ncbi:MAG: Asp-tRNA(Asn)/Glu-tRNA(Gln) amidotransferase subunit GatC [Gemmatimonadota bacterium]|nr:Asp-tRNA(Asn)/Glu-tRNA(Gln) amidotransferase subunit GatC [Gemmatimonadota bacterium]
MAVTRDDVAHIALLARLAIDETRVPALTQQLNGILAHMDVLQKVDTSSAIPVAGVGDAGMPLRTDQGPPIPLARPRESFAPAVRDGFFLVPRLATHEDADDEVVE